MFRSALACLMLLAIATPTLAQEPTTVWLTQGDLNRQSERAPNTGVLDLPAGLIVEVVPLSEGLESLRNASGAPLAFSSTRMEDQGPVSCICEEVTVREALNVMLFGTEFDFSVAGDRILVERKAAAMQHPDELRERMAWMEPPRIGNLAQGLTVRSLAPRRSMDQTGTVEGRVVDAGTGRPLPGTQVQIVGTSLGALTDLEGSFSISDVPAGEVEVRAQRIGYGATSQTVTISEGETVELHFELTQQPLEMSAIVVTGVAAGTQRANVPFSVGTISREEVPVQPRDVTSALRGRVAGAQVVANNRPGEVSEVMLRTPTSIHRSNAPLWVIDGAILTASEVDLSGADFESIEVVRGAAAASLYGARAASGVIQVRTQRGSALPEGNTRFRIRSEYGFSELANRVDWAEHHDRQMDGQGNFLDGDGNIVDRFIAAQTEYGFQDQEYPTEVFDNIGALFSPGDEQSHQLQISHNAGTTSWLAAGGVERIEGPVREHDGYRRGNMRLNVDFAPRDDLRISASAFHMRSTRDDGDVGQGAFFAFAHLAPDIDLLQPDPDGTPYHFQPDPHGVRPNPLYGLYNQIHEARRTRTMASADLRYDPMSNVSIDANLSYDRLDLTDRRWVPRGTKTPNRPDGDIGQLRRGVTEIDGVNAWAGIATTRWLGDLRATFHARGLLELEDNRQVSVTGEDLPVGEIQNMGMARTRFIGSRETQIRSESYLLTGEFIYDDRYIGNAIVRREGSSLFGPDQRWHTYHRVSAGYRMTQEDWWPVGEVGEFRLRFSRGTAGGRPNFADRFEVYSVGTGGILSLSSLGNRVLRPEHTTEHEVGLDVEAFGRLGAELTYAWQTTEDQLMAVPLPANFGFSAQWQNAGTVSGNTIEARLNVDLYQSPTFSWSAGLVADRSRNRIDEYNRPCHLEGGLQATQYWCPGEAIGSIWGGLIAENFDDIAHLHGPDAADAFVVNDDGLLVAVGSGNDWRDGVAKNLWGTTVTVDGFEYDWGLPMVVRDEGIAALRRLGNGTPDLNVGFSNFLTWRGVRLYALVQAQVGGDVYNHTKQRMYQYNRSADQDQAGKPEENKKPTPYYWVLYDGMGTNSWFVEDASHVWLREVSVEYDLNSRRLGFLERTGLDGLGLQLTARNLLLLTDYTGYNPDVGSPMARRAVYDFPAYRSLTASVEVRF